MKEQTFIEVRKELERQGLSIVDDEFNWQAFGSWYIVVERIQQFRLILDGKDSTLSIQQKTKKKNKHGFIIWEDKWYKLNASKIDIDNAIKHLLNFLDEQNNTEIHR